MVAQESYAVPILPAEKEVFPDHLFDEPREASFEDRCWWVMHTRPRQEKSLARQMGDAQVPFYLPLVRRRLLIRGRKLISHVPLFPGYFFLLGSREERVQALSTHRVVNSLVVHDQERLWRDLRQVWGLIATGAPITPEDRLAPGVPVEIRSGPLAGLHGTILRTASGRRFVVQVDFIQRGASVMLDDVHLAAVDEGDPNN
jgi:transcriptional antiterminator RfaH